MLKQENIAFGNVIKTIRNQSGFSQEDLALMANLDRSYISSIEIGRNSPTLTTILSICTALDIPFSNIARLTEIEIKILEQTEPGSNT